MVYILIIFPFYHIYILSIISIEWQISTSCGHMERP